MSSELGSCSTGRKKLINTQQNCQLVDVCFNVTYIYIPYISVIIIHHITIHYLCMKKKGGSKTKPCKIKQLNF